jgi:hypothetical protein
MKFMPYNPRRMINIINKNQWYAVWGTRYVEELVGFPHTPNHVPHTISLKPECHPHINCILFPVKVFRRPPVVTGYITVREMSPNIKIIYNLV